MNRRGGEEREAGTKVAPYLGWLPGNGEAGKHRTLAHAKTESMEGMDDVDSSDLWIGDSGVASKKKNGARRTTTDTVKNELSKDTFFFEVRTETQFGSSRAS